MNPAILVALRLDEAIRRRNWAYAQARWQTLQGWPILEGFHQAEEGPFSPGVAWNRASRQADWDVAVIVGADFLVGDLRQAVTAAGRAHRSGQLVFAHDHHYELTEEGTAALIDDGVPLDLSLTDGVRHPNTFSGVLAVPRTLWDQVGGFDERFHGWGWEDLAFWAACWSLGGGFQRISGPIYHLWHPRPREQREDAPGYAANDELGRRYLAAKGNRAETLKILAERP